MQYYTLALHILCQECCIDKEKEWALKPWCSPRKNERRLLSRGICQESVGITLELMGYNTIVLFGKPAFWEGFSSVSRHSLHLFMSKAAACLRNSKLKYFQPFSFLFGHAEECHHVMPSHTMFRFLSALNMWGFSVGPWTRATARTQRLNVVQLWNTHQNQNFLAVQRKSKWLRLKHLAQIALKGHLLLTPCPARLSTENKHSNHSSTKPSEALQESWVAWVCSEIEWRRLNCPVWSYATCWIQCRDLSKWWDRDFFFGVSHFQLETHQKMTGKLLW